MLATILVRNFITTKIKKDKEVLIGSYKCIEKMIFDALVQDKIIKQWETYMRTKDYLACQRLLDNEQPNTQVQIFLNMPSKIRLYFISGICPDFLV